MAGFNPLEALTGAGIGGNSAAGAFSGQGNVNNISALFSNPQFQQALNALSAQGKNPFEELKQFYVSGKGSKKTAKGAPAGQFLKLGNKQFLDVGSLSAALPGFLTGAEEAKNKAYQETYNKFKEMPQFSQLFGTAEGKFDTEFAKQIDQAFTQIGGQALGAAAPSGFLADPTKQAAVLGPLALSKAQYLAQTQQAAQAQVQGLTGAGGLAGGSPAFLQGPLSQQGYLPGLFQAGGLFQQNQQYNAQLGFQQQVAQGQQFGDLFGSVIGGATAFLAPGGGG